MIIEKFVRDHPASFNDTTGRLHMPVVAVQMVSGPDEARFYRRILAAIGAPEPPRATLSVLESLALRLLAELRPGLLVIDEIHSLQAGTIREQARFLNMLRRESVIDAKMLARVLSVTGGITSGITSGIFSIMSQLAIAAIESGEERIVPTDVSDAGSLRAVLGEPV